MAEGNDVAAVCREFGVSAQTYHHWRNQFGGLTADDAKRLRNAVRRHAMMFSRQSLKYVRIP